MSSSERDVSRRGFLRTAVGAGAVGAAVAAGGSAAAQDGGTTTVDMTDGLVFDPDEISIAPGDTVVWENVGSIGHSVTAYEEDIPGEAEYFASGGFDSEQAARDAYPDGDIGGGGTYEHTFEVEGTYEYFCIPHESAGMLGTVNVGTGGGGDGGDGGDGGGGPPPVPESAVSLVIGGSMALVTALGFVYFFLKYGGDYEAGE
jgi:plastocyanin